MNNKAALALSFFSIWILGIGIAQTASYFLVDYMWPGVYLEQLLLLVGFLVLGVIGILVTPAWCLGDKREGESVLSCQLKLFAASIFVSVVTLLVVFPESLDGVKISSSVTVPLLLGASLVVAGALYWRALAGLFKLKKTVGMKYVGHSEEYFDAPPRALHVLVDGVSPGVTKLSDLIGKGRTASPLQGTFDIWLEGYAATGESGQAHRVAQGIKAASLTDVVAQHVKGLPEHERKLWVCRENGTWTSWGCRAYDNEEQARRTFG